MTKLQRSSCLMRVLTGTVTALLGVLAGGMLVYLMAAVYPILNPALYGLLTANGIPLADDLLWLFWLGAPFITSLVATAVIGWVVGMVAGLIGRK